MSKVEEKAIDSWAIYEYREHPKGLYHTCFVDGYKEGYEQAEEELIPLINRLCEAILFDWKDAADLAWKTLTQIKVWEE